MLTQIVEVAAECIRHPKRRSVWSPELKRYICPDDPEQMVLATAQSAPTPDHRHAMPSIDAQFKFVFLAAASGTVLFMVVCVALTLTAGREPPPLLEKVVMSLFDLVKVGFGAIVGLLGGRAMQSTDK